LESKLPLTCFFKGVAESRAAFIVLYLSVSDRRSRQSAAETAAALTFIVSFTQGCIMKAWWVNSGIPAAQVLSSEQAWFQRCHLCQKR